ncbi:MAG: 4-(cytidine 5-diphospho)-2-C-methyl-D-erythritol kinase [Bacilli bacterium]|nr:4-(cytidine 5-diphospho)-2-C-methyl-D-erythritol kinase [Bacilli bacterium]
MLAERAKAKINLTLDVLYKRPDGYHEVEMIMQTIDLSDHLVFHESSGNAILVSCTAPYIPTDERNLAYKAANLLKQHFSIDDGVSIHIDKRIPVSAGLAGGSADAAAALRGLNQLWNLGLSLEELRELGAQLGSDVPFCLEGGTVLARGRGEVLTRLTPAPPMWVVLVKPAFAVSTADIYGGLQVNEISSRPNAADMLEAIGACDTVGIAAGLGNVLEQVTFAMYPEVERLKRKMIELGGDHTLMSGSGPTVFSLFDRESKAIRLYNALRGFVKEVYISTFY